MAKTLSEQLCEIVGLPYEKTETNCRIQDSNGDFCEEYVYTLDFEQPVNFVKLFNLKIDSEWTCALIITEEEKVIRDSIDFLYSLIRFLNGKWSGQKYEREKIKHVNF